MASLAQPTPGDPRHAGGEPTTLAFRRPADRPGSASKSSATADELAVVLKLPDLARPPQSAADASPIGPTRPWIGIALWTATGILAVVAAVVLIFGKPGSAPPADEAPPWRADSPPSDNDHSAFDSGSPDGHGSQFSSPTSTTASASNEIHPPAGAPAWNAPANPTDPAMASGAASGARGLPPMTTPTGRPGTGAYSEPGLPPTGAPQGGVGPGITSPAGAGPGIGPGQPAGNLGPPTGLPENWPPETDQTKNLEVHGYRTAARPGAATQPGAARLDGRIGNYQQRPGDDSTR